MKILEKIFSMLVPNEQQQKLCSANKKREKTCDIYVASTPCFKGGGGSGEDDREDEYAHSRHHHHQWHRHEGKL